MCSCICYDLQHSPSFQDFLHPIFLRDPIGTFIYWCIAIQDDTSTSQQHMENLKFLEECGLTTDRLRQITISACKSCGVKLSKPPKPSQINHPKYSEALKKARVLLRPCGCITICSGCAPKAVKARRCPCCNKQFTRNEKMEEVPFPIFGYITLE